ncbi:hypothetical protein L484_011803 [Morus notabilis]|uniref:Uncharacterized protein n=1 Tax=Morus notabilis TaxID=981085 RepID=W9S6A1_9ROSA|nr:uncharacterized protein LOC21395043 [Morus notabilis]EXC28299.1 hypothetical protein L484_011803 [Morus notabilis]
MGGHGCSAVDGHLNDDNFSKPMPWIGIYIAAASAACLVAMAADLIQGFRFRKFWFPCNYFSINATSLTLIAVAAKLSVDLNTSMPNRRDQLAKLTSAAFICTVMGNSMPSLGTMGNEDLFMNIMALGILVITIIVNICIQLGTGAIFVFWKEHALFMFIMLVLLIVMSFSALIVPTTKRYLEYKYDKKYELALKEAPSDINGKKLVCKLRKDLDKYWMMAYTCSPQFVMGRSVTCTASGALCLVSAAVLGEAIIRSYFMAWSVKFCTGDSDYKWSTSLVLVIQTIAVGVGTIAPACRWLFAIRFRCPYRGNKKEWRKEFRVEKYWIQRLEEMKDSPLTSSIFKHRNRYCRRVIHDSKNLVLDMCISMQIGIVFTSKLIRFLSIFTASKVLFFSELGWELKRKLRFCVAVSSNDSEEDSLQDTKKDLSRFVLHLEGEEALVKLIIKRNCDATDHWFQLGRKRQPKYLMNLLEKSSQELRGVAEFDLSDQVPCLHDEEPPNCWALPVVTLTSIALALPEIDSSAIRQLRNGVSEGLVYVKHMEKLLDVKADLSNIKKAAEAVWTEVDLYHKWLEVDLKKISLSKETPNEVLEELAQIAKNKFLVLKNAHLAECLKVNPLKWPIKLLAAHSMYRISQSLILNSERINHQTSEKLFEAITVMISDILCACMTNLQQVISVKCLNSAIEEREESVRHAVFILGKSEEILKIHGHKTIPNLDSYQMACIDEWRSSHKTKNPWAFTPSSSEIDTLSPGSTDLCIGID